MSKIILNAVQCLICNDTIESTHVHDFKYCSCRNVFVDGGHDYIRRGARDFSMVLDLSREQND